jgi:hypothetical protein
MRKRRQRKVDITVYNEENLKLAHHYLNDLLVIDFKEESFSRIIENIYLSLLEKRLFVVKLVTDRTLKLEILMDHFEPVLQSLYSKKTIRRRLNQTIVVFPFLEMSNDDIHKLIKIRLSDNITRINERFTMMRRIATVIKSNDKNDTIDFNEENNEQE